MKALWVAADGTKFVVEGNSVEEIRSTIEELRAALGHKVPDIEHIHAMNKEVEQEARQLKGCQQAGENPKLEQFLRATLEATFSSPGDPSKAN